jgi:hypothetical protein
MGSKSVIAVTSAARPLFPHEQTFAGTHRTAVSCQNRTHAAQQSALLESGAVGRFTNFHREGKGAGKILSMPCRTTA